VILPPSKARETFLRATAGKEKAAVVSLFMASVADERRRTGLA
jgi:hypothetical protein